MGAGKRVKTPYSSTKLLMIPLGANKTEEKSRGTRLPREQKKKQLMKMRDRTGRKGGKDGTLDVWVENAWVSE